MPAVRSWYPLAAAIALICAGSIAQAASSTSIGPHAPTAQSWPVTSCADDGPGSLRQVVANNQTQSGDTIDLSQIQCATITLSTGAIDIPQNDLTLRGPGATRLTIDATGSSRLFTQAAGRLHIDGSKLSGGTYHAAGPAHGGCILGAADVYLSHTEVSNCSVTSDTGIAAGGAVFAKDITLVASRVSDSEAASSTGVAYGGGVAATHGVLAKYSTLSNNRAEPGTADTSDGGAIYAAEYASVIASTIDHNTASIASGIHAGLTIDMSESTVSGNLSTQCCALMAAGAYGIAISNSTVAFNHTAENGRAAVYFKGTMVSGSVSLQSSILANNTAGANLDPGDLLVIGAFVEGADNLVMSANAPLPPGVVIETADPLLGELGANGGTTQTHALGRGSPARDRGNNSDGASFDQRGIGYPRETGSSASVDIGAFQFDSVFAATFE